jgi:hypothetical protein
MYIEVRAMSSPFPGMDPYLETPAFWADFHGKFVHCWCEAIADQLPDAYDARVDETVNLVELSDDEIRTIYPDIAVTRSRRHRRTKASPGSTLLLEPVTIANQGLLDFLPQRRIEIRNRMNRRLIAVLELLSPTNKIGGGFGEYGAKRIDILRQSIHLVELDLLVGGKRPPLSQPLPAGDYHVYISRADRRPDCEVYTWTVRDPLPTIPVPLKAPDADIRISLAEVFQTTYQRGRYARALAYKKPPIAPLKPRDAKWAKALAAKI